MIPTTEQVERLRERLRLNTPILAIYDAAPDETFAPTVEAKGSNCIFSFYEDWLAGCTIVIRKGEGHGCGGGQRALGLEKKYPPFMAHFLTDGVGAPKGEGLRANADLAKAFLDSARPPDVASGTILIGPLRLPRWDAVRSLTFLVDPDRLSALMTLSAYWSADTRLVSAPFSSGCGMMLRELEAEGEADRPIIGTTDIAMRRFIPSEMMSLTVSPKRFQQMLGFPEDCFLYRAWWNELMDGRRKA